MTAEFKVVMTFRRLKGVESTSIIYYYLILLGTFIPITNANNNTAPTFTSTVIGVGVNFDKIDEQDGVSKTQLNAFQNWKQSAEQHTYQNHKDWLNGNNPYLLQENNKYPFKPTLLIGAFNTSVITSNIATDKNHLDNSSTKIVMTTESLLL
ncbi:hypothetical protein BCR32DRAFT_248992 [Anaeromyces robustus]|uniref:Uncharacterized protein n=1 Tax=Anaeromyces robustus TaxID=1754192 RepID=A0A1Y1WS61_9FUNG|nr:hypothetical protein BCR32DRAFT_248992 [Anaeromyces robustus]|eukprot:ORX76118.1 hypothetical protein BCR32DRAFT_248992 [Anaeromyces robustus]